MDRETRLGTLSTEAKYLLALKLNPRSSGTQSNWVDLAEELGFSRDVNLNIERLTERDNVFDYLMEKWEDLRLASLPRLVKALDEVKRPDCVYIIQESLSGRPKGVDQILPRILLPF